jgi:hypothetical protein
VLLCLPQSQSTGSQVAVNPMLVHNAKMRDHEVTKRHHGYQRISPVFQNAQKPVLLWK